MNNKNIELSGFKTPILLLGFNRPDRALRVFEEIRKMRPQQFFLAVDGPRVGNTKDVAACQLTRDIALRVDWPCEIKTLFQDTNLGCGLGPVTAIDWFFENVSEGIILEDDCVPDPSFFYFCQELLEYYRDTEKIMHISGDNFQHGKKRGEASYYFSEYTHNWGWATWRRAWRYYDFNALPHEQRRHIWDKQWLMSVRKNGGLAILPNVNLVSNIGFGADATHTRQITEHANMRVEQMEFPLVHPKSIQRNIRADFLSYREIFGGSIWKLILQKVLPIIPAQIKIGIKKTLQMDKVSF